VWWGGAGGAAVSPPHRDPAVAHHLLEEILVHRERRARDPRADVRDACKLEQPLHRPVLAERAVEDRQDDVDRAEGGESPSLRVNGQRLRRTSPPCVDGGVRHQGRSRGASLERPAAVAADRDADHVVPLRIERREDGAGRGERDLVLARAPAGEEGDAESLRHGVVVVVAVVVPGL
jgi:hypothetical protein